MIQRLGQFFTGSTGLERKLGRYTLAGTALLGLPAIAQASSIYYSGPIDVTITDISLTENLPVVGPTASFTISATNGATPRFFQSIDVSGTDTSFVDDTSNFPVDLNAGDIISAANATGPGGQLSGFVEVPPKLYSGNWPRNGTPGLLGLSFTSGADQFNGWARIIANPGGLEGPESATLVDFAYNETPGDPIAAGEAPEPSSLALFALGAAGILALRKRRQASR
jgi:hypothetical protein